jgi:hypothetical protein
LECGVVLPVLAVVIVILVLSGVCVYAIDRIRPGWLRIEAGTGRKPIFRIEMGQGSIPAPREERRELEARPDKPRELEAGPGDSEPSSASGEQDNAPVLHLSSMDMPRLLVGDHTLGAC